MSTPPTTLIIGAGIFGTSTAYHLSQTTSPSTITLLDRSPFPPTTTGPGASHDFHKIIRADYSTRFYMNLAHTATAAWRASPLLSPFYHETGRVTLQEVGSDLSTRVRANFRSSGFGDPTRDVGFEEVRTGWSGVLEQADMEGFESAYWTDGAGWADGKALGAMLEETVGRGVKYAQGEVEGLVLKEGGKGVRGVRVVGGNVVEADRVLLATGAWTSKMLAGVEDELMVPQNDRIEGQVKAAGVVVAGFELVGEERNRYMEMPVVVYGASGEFLPLTTSGILKFNNANTFVNTIITPSNHSISVPPSHPQSVVPPALQNETLALISRVFPSVPANNKVAFWRLCWDSVTPEQDQLICVHPHIPNLYLAVGGSFHSWKFLPIIGKHVKNMLEGKGNGEEADKHWGWKSVRWGHESGKGAHEKVVPKRELRDLEKMSVGQ